MMHERAALRWGRRGECFGETAAVPSLELDPHEPVGLGGWGWVLACTNPPLKLNSRSAKATGADIGVADERKHDSNSSGLEALAENTALDSGLVRLSFSPQLFTSTPSRRVREVGGLELVVWAGNENIFSDILRVSR